MQVQILTIVIPINQDELATRNLEFIVAIKQGDLGRAIKIYKGYRQDQDRSSPLGLLQKRSMLSLLIFLSIYLGKSSSSFQAKSRDWKMVRTSYWPWAMNSDSNILRKSRQIRSSLERASSPTTAFMAAVSLPMAQLAQSWLLTSGWSTRVMPLPMAFFMSREREGSTLMGGQICLLFSCRSMKICPSVMQPVRSGIGWVMSSFNMDRIGIWVIDPFLPFTRPARSQIVERSVQRQPGQDRRPGTSSLAADTSRRESAQADMSVRITRTCSSCSQAKYSAVVRASRGVMMRSMVGSLARFMKRTTLSIEPFCSKSVLKNRATSMLTPMAPKTMAKFSSLWSNTSLPLTREACRTICAPISLWGRPFAEKRGIFCPRAILFMVSIAEMPVWIISWGYTLWQGLMGWPWIDRNFQASTGGPLSMGTPDPLKARPNISSEMGISRVWPVNQQWVQRLSRPLVPSNICTTAFFPAISRTCPLRTQPSGRYTFTISAQRGNLTLSRMTRGPSTFTTVRQSIRGETWQLRVAAMALSVCTSRSFIVDYGILSHGGLSSMSLTAKLTVPRESATATFLCGLQHTSLALAPASALLSLLSVVFGSHRTTWQRSTDSGASPAGRSLCTPSGQTKRGHGSTRGTLYQLDCHSPCSKLFIFLIPSTRSQAKLQLLQGQILSSYLRLLGTCSSCDGTRSSPVAGLGLGFFAIGELLPAKQPSAKGPPALKQSRRNKTTCKDSPRIVIPTRPALQPQSAGGYGCIVTLFCFIPFLQQVGEQRRRLVHLYRSPGSSPSRISISSTLFFQNFSQAHLSTQELSC